MKTDEAHKKNAEELKANNAAKQTVMSYDVNDSTECKLLQQ